VTIPWDLDDGSLVKVETASGEYEVEECNGSEYNSLLGDKDDPLAYDLDSDEHCYTSDGDNVYIATTHFSVFGAGEEEEVEEESSSSGTMGGYYRKISRVKTPADEAGGAMNQYQHVDDFADLIGVDPNSWRYLAIKEVMNKGLFEGRYVGNQTIFDMDGNMTRGMASTVICRYMGCDEDALVGSMSFTDVPTNAYYAAAVGYLKGQGIVSGKTSTTFDPSGTVTRSEFFKMLVQAYMSVHPEVMVEWQSLLTGRTDYFSDVAADAWYAGYMNFAAKTGLLKGYQENGKVYAKGGQDVTRIEAAAMIGYFLGL